MVDVLAGFGVLKDFSSVFVFLMVWVILFGIAEYGKFFGENKGLHAIFGLVIAILVVIVPGIREVIALMTPWFAFLIIIFVLVVLIFKFFGVSDTDLVWAAKDKTLMWWVIIFSLIIIIGSLGRVYFTGQTPEREAENVIITEDGRTVINVTAGSVASQGTSAFWATIFHPKVLGFIFIILIASFTIRQLAGYTS